MIVKVNTLSINDPSVPGIYLEEDVIGLDLPGIRTSSGDFAGRPGGYVGGQFFGPRPITLTGRVFATDVTSLYAMRKQIQAALIQNWSSSNAQFLVTLQVTTDDGAAYVIFANLIDFDMPIKRTKVNAPFKIELVAPDALVYDNATGTALTASVGKRVSGGYTYPVVYPVIYGAGTAPTTVTNSGTQSVWPTITLTGSATNPVITNLTTGQFMGLSLTMGAGDVLTINMRDRTVLLNGGSVFGLIAANSTFWRLQPGGNDISLTTSNGTDAVTGLVSWRSGFLGI